MRILGLDPGTGRFGWAVVEKEGIKFNLIASGCFETPAKTKLGIRLRLIFDDLTSVIANYQPNKVAMEELFFTKNQTTAISVAEARGVALLVCEQAGLVVDSFSPSQIKSDLTGNGRADKKQMAFMVSQTLKTKDLPKLDDTVDAIAVAITAFFRLNARMPL